MAEDGMVSEYSDPILYDAENPDAEPDATFYRDLVQRYPGPVLDLGCGTGRVTLPLAHDGVVIIGLDLAPEMIAQARTKDTDKLITWIVADAREFHLDEQFSLIIETGSTFQHQLNRGDQEAVFARIHEHLAPEGRFVVNCWFPSSTVGDEPETDWFTYTDDLGRHVQVSGTVRYDRVTQVHTETATRRWQLDGEPPQSRTSPVSLRYLYPAELETLLYYNGFEVTERYGGTDGSPLSDTSRAIIYVCQAAPYSLARQ